MKEKKKIDLLFIYLSLLYKFKIQIVTKNEFESNQFFLDIEDVDFDFNFLKNTKKTKYNVLNLKFLQSDLYMNSKMY